MIESIQSLAPERSSGERSSTIAEELIDCFLATPYEALPAAAITTTKTAIVDLLGVMLAGAAMPMARICADYYLGLGGRPEASVAATATRIPAVNACLVNGVAAHALDMDDGHRRAGGHPGVVTLPAALATAELYGRSGRELLRSVVFGYETLVRIAAAINPAHLRRGFHVTSTVGPFAAAVASGILAGLARERLVRAIGLAGIQGAGLLEVLHDGAMAKPFQTARASAAGLLAAELAARGAEGPRSVLEGDGGFLGAMSDAPGARDAILDGLGRDWAISGVYFKAHAACRHTHAAVDAAAALRDEHGVRPEEVAEVVVRTYAVADRLCGDARLPAGPSEAKFSLGFAVALGLTFGHARASCFAPELVADEGLRALASKVHTVVDPELERRYPEQRSAVLDVTTVDGRQRHVEVPMARGEPELPFTRHEIEAKFMENATRALSEREARALLERVDGLDTAPSCRPLIDVLARRAPG